MRETVASISVRASGRSKIRPAADGARTTRPRSCAGAGRQSAFMALSRLPAVLRAMAIFSLPQRLVRRARRTVRSLQRWLRQPRLERCRRAMLLALQGLAEQPAGTVLARRIAQAGDARTLWQLRPELARLLAAVHHERVVQDRMANISFLFAGLLRRHVPAGPPVLHRSDARGA